MHVRSPGGDRGLRRINGRTRIRGMKWLSSWASPLLAISAVILFAAGSVNAQSVLPSKDQALTSWNDSAAKSAITDFVGRVTREGGPDYVKPEERIAVFDNDGTLWTEQPMYFQM